MALTRADIIARAKRRLRYSGDSFITPAEQYAAFGDVYRQWAMDTRCLGVEVTFSVVSGTSEYALSDIDPRIFRVRSLRYRSSSSSNYRELPQASYAGLPDERVLYSGVPSEWATRGGSIVLTSNPSASVTDGFSVSAYRTPTALAEDSSADATALEFPEHHRDGLVWGMIRELALTGREDPILAGVYDEAKAEYAKAAMVAEREAANLTGKAGAWAGGPGGVVVDPRIPSHWGPAG